jgi:glycosyltransferase involved in cell wall biosynthesis
MGLDTSTTPPRRPLTDPRVGVLVVAYNAATTLVPTLQRLPQSFLDVVDHIMVCDDASQDNTYEVGLEFQRGTPLPLTIVRHATNLGYGGNQKAGYNWAIEHGLDVVVLLHADGQYAPEHINSLFAPLVAGKADAVFGSRMLTPGGALSGGMPRYKYVGNRILTAFQNRMTGLKLSEWHSGYRAYRIDALRDLDYLGYSDGFDFDTEIILGLWKAGKRIMEVPIPTYYGEEICYVNGVKYARDVAADVVKHWSHARGFGGGISSTETDAYALKACYGSHRVLLDWLDRRPPSTVLDVGCFDGRFAELAREQGHSVTGLDRLRHEGVEKRVDRFVEADLNQPLPEELEPEFDVVVAGDILEHVMEPHALLADLVTRVRPGGEVLVSVPNFGHWYPRGRIALGRFDYDQRGPLDRGHIRFFTRNTIEQLFREVNLHVLERQTVGTPFDLVAQNADVGLNESTATRLSRADDVMIKVWPRLFGYQFLYRLEVE